MRTGNSLFVSLCLCRSVLLRFCAPALLRFCASVVPVVVLVVVVPAVVVPVVVPVVVVPVVVVPVVVLAVVVPGVVVPVVVLAHAPPLQGGQWAGCKLKRQKITPQSYRPCVNSGGVSLVCLL